MGQQHERRFPGFLSALLVQPSLKIVMAILPMCLMLIMERTHGLLAEMRTMRLLDTVSMNAMLKGFCSLGDMKRAQELLKQIQCEGLNPDEALTTA